MSGARWTYFSSPEEERTSRGVENNQYLDICASLEVDGWVCSVLYEEWKRNRLPSSSTVADAKDPTRVTNSPPTGSAAQKPNLLEAFGAAGNPLHEPPEGEKIGVARHRRLSVFTSITSKTWFLCTPDRQSYTVGGKSGSTTA